jgi:hypothetical protein
MLKIIKTHRGTVIGIAVGVAMRGAATLFGSHLSLGLNELLFYGGTAIAVFFLSWILWDWIKSRLQLPAWLPRTLRTWLAWQMYPPIIGDPVQIQTYGNSTVAGTELGQIFLTVPVDAVFPYGQTVINFDGSFIRVRQARRSFHFEIKKKNNTIMRIGMPGSHGMSLDYFIEQQPNSETFDPSGEFRWTMDGISASLNFNDGASVEKRAVTRR